MSHKTPSDALKRQGNFERKVDATRIGALITTLESSMASNLGGQLSSLEAVYTAVQAVLASESSVTVFLETAYQNYARQIWYAKNSHAGAALNSEVTAITGDWEDRGLNTTIMTRICLEVFGIGAPGALDGILNLTATPSDAHYSISPGHGGSPLTGTCPLVGGVLVAGAQTITLTKALYKNWVGELTFSSGEAITLAATLELA